MSSAVLPAPVVGEDEGVDVRPGPELHLLEIERVDLGHEPGQPVGPLGQVHIEVLRAAQELDELEGPGPGLAQDERLRLRAEPVDLRRVDGQPLGGDPDPVDIRPAREYGVLDLADDAGLLVLEAAAPLVDEKAGLVFLALRLQRLPQEGRAGDDIVGEPLADGGELGRPGPLGPGQEPEVARHPRRGAEFEAVDDETARGHQAARSRPISSTAEAASGA